MTIESHIIDAWPTASLIAGTMHKHLYLIKGI